MTSEELIRMIGEGEPALLDKIASVFKEAEGDQELLQELSESIDLVAGRITDFEKTAAEGESLRDLFRQGAGKALGTTAVAAGAGLALAGGSDLYNLVKSKATKHRNWKRMMAANPTWKNGEWDESNPMTESARQKLPRAFDTVHRLAPTIASDPVTASHYVRTLANSPDMGDALKKLVDTQKTVNETKEKRRFRP